MENRAQRFRDLIEPLLNDAYTLARFLARDPTVAEDIVQEASLRAFRHVESLASAEGRALRELSAEELDSYWNRAKTDAIAQPH